MRFGEKPRFVPRSKKAWGLDQDRSTCWRAGWRNCFEKGKLKRIEKGLSTDKPILRERLSLENISRIYNGIKIRNDVRRQLSDELSDGYAVVQSGPASCPAFENETR